jgi:hypothetical protein
MATGNYLGQRYSTPIVIPDSSQIDDKRTNDEMNYVLNALRTTVLQLDALTGGLSPLTSNWPTISPLEVVFLETILTSSTRSVSLTLRMELW